MNDLFRLNYTELSGDQLKNMRAIKLKAQELLDLMKECVPPNENTERGRCMDRARDVLETAVMYAVKGVTTKL